MEILLEGCLYSHIEFFKDDNQFIESMRMSLNSIGVIHRRKIKLRSPKQIEKLLVTSIMKLNSILKIVELEHTNLGSELRLVVLTDFIRKSDMPHDSIELPPLRRLGVVPIFEKIRREGSKNIKLGVLCGSLVIIPRSAKNSLENILHSNNINNKKVKFTKLPMDKNFYEVKVIGQYDKHIVKIITELFTSGEITVLVGTKSLLGEGWDAPSVNTLIMASFVGSYMLSNQMRGRAIRSLPFNPDKTANIWHLFCVEEKSIDPGTDFETLNRRFKSFVGVSFNEPIIENGINRLDIGNPPFNKSKIKIINQKMCQKAIDRKRLKHDWNEALRHGFDDRQLVEDIETSSDMLPRKFILYNTIEALFIQSIFVGLYITNAMLRGARTLRFTSMEGLLFYLGLTFAIGILLTLPNTMKAFWLFYKHGPVASSMQQIGKTLLESLIYEGTIKTEKSKLEVVSEKGDSGTVLCHLKGGTYSEKSRFLDSLQEIFDPIENPRYLIVRKSTLLRKILRIDYHAIPRILGTKKEYAEFFQKEWKKHVGSVELYYTRSKEGRKLLLWARNQSLASSFQKKSHRISQWK
jgi:hypothetical protein